MVVGRSVSPKRNEKKASLRFRICFSCARVCVGNTRPRLHGESRERDTAQKTDNLCLSRDRFLFPPSSFSHSVLAALHAVDTMDNREESLFSVCVTFYLRPDFLSLFNHFPFISYLFNPIAHTFMCIIPVPVWTPMSVDKKSMVPLGVEVSVS